MLDNILSSLKEKILKLNLNIIETKIKLISKYKDENGIYLI